ncbi:MAG: hypothetical protein ACFFEE_07655 [Candidatus Thorarchaeota archaeon]
MHRRHPLLLSCVFILLFIMMGTVSAQASLVANIERTSEHVSGGDTNHYVADLEAGHWTIVVDTESFWGLEVKITVATDSGYTNIITESGTDYGNYPTVDFDLASNSTVYIGVTENSVYSDTSGFYDIGVYDDAHIPGFFQTLDFFDWIFIFIAASIILPLCIGLIACRRVRRSTQPIRMGRRMRMARRRRMDGILVEAPMHVIPDEHQEKVMTHGSRTTTVRLPLNCPSCDAVVSHESVDWVGPLEAKCSYCGATMRATFEDI